MAKLKDMASTAREVFAPIGTGVGAALTVFGGVQAITGWNPVGGERLVIIGLMIFAACGAWVIISTYRKVSENDALIGNEHARALWRDGIPALREEYLSRVQKGDYAVVIRFWAAGFTNVRDSERRGDLHLACEFGHGAIVQGLLDRGADPKQIDGSNRTPLMLGMWQGKPAVVGALLAHDCALDATCSDDGCSALHYAAAHGHLEIIKKLIDSGANLDRVNHTNMSPVMAAMAKQHWPVAAHLLLTGAASNRVDAFGATVMDYACEFGAPQEMIENLSKLGIARAEPRLTANGQGFSRYGHARVQWTREANPLAVAPTGTLSPPDIR